VAAWFAAIESLSVHIVRSLVFLAITRIREALSATRIITGILLLLLCLLCFDWIIFLLGKEWSLSNVRFLRKMFGEFSQTGKLFSAVSPFALYDGSLSLVRRRDL